MDILQTIIIAIVEGLTEFLPVSSTGHMIIAQSLLGVESTPFVKAFTVIIQFGAILSVICLYWKRFFYPEAVKSGQSYWKSMYDFYARLVVGVLPAVVLGLAFNDFIESKALPDVVRLPTHSQTGFFVLRHAPGHRISEASHPVLLDIVATEIHKGEIHEAADGDIGGLVDLALAAVDS